MVREKRDTNPVLFKLIVGLAISIGGIFYSILRPKKMKPSISPSTSGLDNEVDSEGIRILVKDEALDNSENQEDHSVITTTFTQNNKKDRTLLPEFEEIVKDFNMSSPKAYITPEKDSKPIYTYKSELERMKIEDYEQEISTLNNRVEFLQKRVSTLETELLKYYGLKEQESTIQELQNRVKIHNTEAKLFNLKIETLQVENKKMKGQVAEYSETVSELEVARGTVDFLKKKLKSEAEQNKKQLLSLQERVKKMQDQELEAVSGDKSVELKLQRIKQLEEEAEELRKCNSNLRNEKLELAQKLEQSEIQDHKVKALKEETRKLNEENLELSKQVEQLQSSWCADIEELVYLRWINACLRYEARNYQPEPGKTSSRDLRKTLSPKSEEKAKKLIMEYANKQGLEEKGRHITDWDFDQWSLSQFSNSNSNNSENGDLDDDSSLDQSNKTDTSSKRRIFSKLRKLLRGEDENNHKIHHDNWSLPNETSFIDSPRMRRLSIGSERHLRGIKIEELKELEFRRRNSDIGLPRVYENQLEETSGMAEERFKLAKYAEVLRDSDTDKFHRRAVSHS